MRRFSFLWAAAYFMALVLIVTPIMDVTMAALPLTPGEAMWRFAAMGIFAEGVMTPLLGVLFLVLIASYLEHRAVLKTVGALCAIAFVLFVGVIGLFFIESIEMRAKVVEEARGAFGVASIGAFFKWGTGAISVLLFSIGAFKEAARLAPSARDRTSEGFLVGAPRPGAKSPGTRRVNEA